MCRGQYQVLLSGAWVNVDEVEAQKLHEADFCLRVDPGTPEFELDGVSRTPAAADRQFDSCFEG